MRENQNAFQSLRTPKYKTIKIGEYIFEVKTVRALKVGEDGVYGDPYDAMCYIDFIDGKANVNSLCGVGFTKRCYLTIVKYIREHRGVKEVIYKRVKNLKDKFKKAKG